ncbi:alkaline phosphatase family protein [Cupriavidus pauculus]|uniref:alkaline phosphatase family protein n=1 Tax=Cupriavidus pauculus TaxID=82633 RepID=UPI0009FE99A0|nr:alkaline phosphatase family protein [Cupriavidus pauculus]
MTKKLVDLKIYFVSVLATGLMGVGLIFLEAGTKEGSADPAPRPASAVTRSGALRIHHVFIVVLENKDYKETFDSSSQAQYLKKTLPAMGAKLTEYYGTAHASLANYIAMISGQPATADTQEDCPVYKDFVQTGTSIDGFPVGNGCVYPPMVKTLPDQLKARNLTWKGYMEDMGNDPARESTTCGHPTIGTADLTHMAVAPSAKVPSGDQYATRHNPFVYFHSIIDSPDCNTNVVALNELEADLAYIETTPNFVFITPNLCSDGHDGDGTGMPGRGCVDGKPGGLTSADEFLKTWVPKIIASSAYRQDGLLIITFDEGEAFKGDACCGQQMGPNAKRPSSLRSVLAHTLMQRSYGGDRTGAVLISPFIKPGTVSDTPYNHYSLLKSIENIFQVSEYLGYAGQLGLVAFGSDIFAD